MKIHLEHSKFLWITSAIFRSPAKSVRKDPGSSQNSYKLFWKSYGYHHNRCENQPGTFKAVMDSFGKSPGHQQNWHSQNSYRLFWQSYGWR